MATDSKGQRDWATIAAKKLLEREFGTEFDAAEISDWAEIIAEAYAHSVAGPTATWARDAANEIASTVAPVEWTFAPEELLNRVAGLITKHAKLSVAVSPGGKQCETNMSGSGGSIADSVEHSRLANGTRATATITHDSDTAPTPVTGIHSGAATTSNSAEPAAVPPTKEPK